MISPALDHVGIVVPDLKAAVDEFSELFGYEWQSQPDDSDGGVLRMRRPDREGMEPIRIRAAQSIQYPRIELIENNPGTPWEMDGSGYVLHHIALWSSNLIKDSKAILDRCPMRIWGVANETDETPVTFTYQFVGKGLTVEFLDDMNGGEGDRLLNWGSIVLDA